MEVKGQQHVPHLKQEALLVEETHPPIATDTTPEILPVLYYPREGYLVRDTTLFEPSTHQLNVHRQLGRGGNADLTLVATHDGTDWKHVDEKHWAKASKLNIAYHIHPEKRETVAVKAGEYKDCVPVEGTVNRGDGSGYRYQEWYAPGVGLVKSTTTDLLNEW